MKYLTIILSLLLLLSSCAVFIRRSKVTAFLESSETKSKIAQWCISADTYIRGSKMGQEKLAYVCGKLAEYVPGVFQPFITAQILRQMVNAVFDEIKESLECNVIKSTEV